MIVIRFKTFCIHCAYHASSSYLLFPVSLSVCYIVCCFNSHAVQHFGQLCLCVLHKYNWLDLTIPKCVFRTIQNTERSIVFYCCPEAHWNKSKCLTVASPELIWTIVSFYSIVNGASSAGGSALVLFCLSTGKVYLLERISGNCR